MNVNWQPDRDAPVKIDFPGGIAYEGVSIGGEKTCHVLHSIGIAFDIGMAFPGTTTINNIFITHVHKDHVWDLITHAIRRNSWGLSPATYYVPEAHVRRLMDEFIRPFCALFKAPVPNIVGLPVNAAVLIKNYTVQSFVVPHKKGMLTYGYVVTQTVPRLKEEFKHLQGHEIAALKQKGISVSSPATLNVVSFYGDCNKNVFTTGVPGLDSKLVIMECSFFDDQVTPQSAYDNGHLHIEDIDEHMYCFENARNVLLTHFSARYSGREIRNGMRPLVSRGFNILS